MAANFCELLPAFITKNFAMSRHNSNVSSGFLLIFCRDIVPLLRQCSATICLVLCRDRVVKRRDKIFMPSSHNMS